MGCSTRGRGSCAGRLPSGGGFTIEASASADYESSRQLRTDDFRARMRRSFYIIRVRSTRPGAAQTSGRPAASARGQNDASRPLPRLRARALLALAPARHSAPQAAAAAVPGGIVSRRTFGPCSARSVKVSEGSIFGHGHARPESSRCLDTNRLSLYRWVDVCIMTPAPPRRRRPSPSKRGPSAPATSMKRHSARYLQRRWTTACASSRSWALPLTADPPRSVLLAEVAIGSARHMSCPHALQCIPDEPLRNAGWVLIDRPHASKVSS